jgi:three-Cys-motif partner protein
MSKKLPTVWEAPAHTIAKIEMLRSYLHAWLSIIGARFARQDLWYIDGFAGPGEYKNFSDGSPVAALKTAEAAIEKTGSRWTAGRVHCVFIEENGERFRHLQQRLATIPENPRISRYPYHGWSPKAGRRSEAVWAYVRRDAFYGYGLESGCTSYLNLTVTKKARL